VVVFFQFGLFPSEFRWKQYCIHKEGFISFLLVKTSSRFMLLSFITDPRKLKVCALSILYWPLFTFLSYFYCFCALISMYFVFSWLMLNHNSFAFSFRVFNNSYVAYLLLAVITKLSPYSFICVILEAIVLLVIPFLIMWSKIVSKRQLTRYHLPLLLWRWRIF
jgi:hypothetical protein